MSVMEVFVEALESFMEVTSTEVSMEACVVASMEDVEYFKASVGLNSTGASTKASTKSSMEVPSTKAAIEAFIV